MSNSTLTLCPAAPSELLSSNPRHLWHNAYLCVIGRCRLAVLRVIFVLLVLVMSVTLPAPLTSKPFRHDINGLRALAVVAVVLYHFGVPGVSGGFVGVDVFFVLSGFLMTGIIISGLERGDFSLWGFYLARARRIIPALLALCASLLLLGWFWLPNADYRMLATHVATAVAFVSNLKFWREAGYFDAASHEKWLLHSWSLSAEWQFYILLPLGCLLLWHWFGRRGLKWALLLAGLASLALSVYASNRWPGAAFYLLPTRAWEMLAGGLVWWLTRQARPIKQAWALEALGLTLIIGAVIGFDASLVWPGYLALVPVLGTMLVLAANRQDSWLTSNGLARRLGASSYSIYLWHWPLVVALTYAGEQASPSWMVLGLLGSVLLGELSLRWIETPARKGLTRTGSWPQTLLLGGVVWLIGLAAVAVYVGNKLNQPWVMARLAPEINLVADEGLNVKPRRDICFATSGEVSPSCIYGGEQISAIVIGDSHADAITTAVTAATDSPLKGVLDWSYVSCPTIFGLHVLDEYKELNCFAFNYWAKVEINKYDKSIPLVIINRASVYALGQHNIKEKMNVPLSYFTETQKTITDNFLHAYSTALVETACYFAKDRAVYITRPIPEMMNDVPKTMARALMFGKADPLISISLEEYHARHAVVWAAQDEAARQCGVKILDPLPYLCHDGRCWSSKAGRPLYYDDDHLSEYGNKLLVPMFRQIFEHKEADGVHGLTVPSEG